METLIAFAAGFLIAWGINSWLRAKESREWKALHRRALENWKDEVSAWKEVSAKWKELSNEWKDRCDEWVELTGAAEQEAARWREAFREAHEIKQEVK